jgi:hypothetical protein
LTANLAGGGGGAFASPPPVPPASVPPPVPPSVPNAPKVERSETRRFACSAADTSRIVTDLANWLGGQGFEYQQMNTDGSGLLLQIKKGGGWSTAFGMDTSLNILFNHADETLSVEIGAGKWIDKAAAGAVGMFLLWPLAITAGVGAWQQMKMPQRIFEFIGARLAYRN